MALVGSPLFNPATKESDLGLGETFFFGMWRRHRFIAGGFRDAVDQFAIIWFARNDCGEAIVVFEGTFPSVEAEVGLACLFVGAVAEEALVGKDGPDVAVEDHFL